MPQEHHRTLWLADVVQNPQIATDVRQMYFIDSNTIIYPVESVKDCRITTTPTTNHLQTHFSTPCRLCNVPVCTEHACTRTRPAKRRRRRLEGKNLIGHRTGQTTRQKTDNLIGWQVGNSIIHVIPSLAAGCIHNLDAMTMRLLLIDVSP